MAQPLQTTPLSSTPAAAASTDFVEKTPLERYVPPAKPSLVGLSRAQLTEALASIGVPAAQRKMRVQQIWHWLYVRGARGFDEMTSVSKEVRALLERHFTLARPEVVAEHVSVDGTRTCSFCHTGTQRLVRNLTPGEIVGQIMVARDRLGDWLGAARASGDGLPTQGERFVSNIVMMGMGEPLYNFEAVRDALLIAADGEGIAISKRRITLSTSGVVPNISRAGAEIGCMLAVSLHAVRDELRNELVPLNRKY